MFSFMYLEEPALLHRLRENGMLSVFVPELHGLDPNRDANNDYTDFVNTRV